jgi:cation:H+ antiporter
MFDIFLIIAGLVLLFIGGEGLVRGAVSLARGFGLSKLLVSAVIVGFGTSMPEMTVSVGAALKGASDIAVGNVVGSNIANILLIIGIAALLYPISVSGSAVKRDSIVMLSASLILCFLALYGSISLLAGLAMFGALIAYIVWSYSQDRKKTAGITIDEDQIEEAGAILPPFKASLFSLTGLALLIGGASLMVEGAVSIARQFGLSEAVIGLTIVAVGTSLPELATSLVAAWRRHSDVIVGNIVGSNIFNIFAILGMTAIISPVSIAPQIAAYDVWIMLAVASVLGAYLLMGKTIGKASGGLMVFAYIGYTYWLYTL